MEKEDIRENPSFDIIDVAKNIAKEKGIDEMEVIDAMESAIAKAGRTKYGFELDIRAHVDKKTGKINLFRYQEVVEDINLLPSEERINKINISSLSKQKSLNVGEFVKEELPPLDFGRIAVQTAKQVIFSKVKRLRKLCNLMNLRIESEKL